MIWKILAWLVSRRPAAAAVIWLAQRLHGGCHIPPESGEYMRRWWLVNPPLEYGGAPRHSWLPFEIRVHHIRRADRDRHLHDHPWNWRSIVLRGYYLELGEDGAPRLRVGGSFSGFRRAADAHRIVDVADGGAWTLFFVGRRTNAWGFYTEKGKIPWRKYLGME